MDTIIPIVFELPEELSNVLSYDKVGVMIAGDEAS